MRGRGCTESGVRGGEHSGERQVGSNGATHGTSRDVRGGAVHGVGGKRWRALQGGRSMEQRSSTLNGLRCARRGPCTEYAVRGGTHSKEGEVCSNGPAHGRMWDVRGGAMHRVLRKRWRALQLRRSGKRKSSTRNGLECTRRGACTECVVKHGKHCREGEVCSKGGPTRNGLGCSRRGRVRSSW